MIIVQDNKSWDIFMVKSDDDCCFFYCWLRLLLLFLATFRFRSRLPEAAGVHEPVNNTETRVQLRSFQSWWWWGWWWGGGGGWWGWWWWGWRIIMINSVCRVVHLRLSTRNSLDGHLLNLATISPIYLYEVFRVLDVMKQICTFSSMKLQSLPILSKCLSFAVFFAQNCPYSARLEALTASRKNWMHWLECDVDNDEGTKREQV